MRIGEISKALERGHGGPGRGKKKRLPRMGQAFKVDVLKAAKLSHAVAQRAEELFEHVAEVDVALARCSR
jgi:hypothetical protein